jgi:AhpD family alkylhydroperoxidase
MARMGADAFGYRGDLRIDRGLAQLVRLRVSQLNNCTYCLNLHDEAAREAGIPRAKIDTVTAWGRPSFTQRPSRRRSLHRGAHPRRRHRSRCGVSALHDALAEHFTPEEMLEIVAVVVNMTVWTRIKLAETTMPGPWDLVRRSP